MTDQQHAAAPLDVQPTTAAGAALPRGLVVAAASLAALGVALSAAALIDPANRPRLAFAWLWSFALLWAVGMGCLFFVALHYLTHSIWSVVVKRVAEMLVTVLLPAAIMFIPLLLFAWLPEQFKLFPWMQAEGHAERHVPRAYLNWPFFLARAAVYFALWLGFAWYFLSRSRRQDATAGDTRGMGILPMTETGDPSALQDTGKMPVPRHQQTAGAATLSSMRRMRNVSGPFMIVFAFTVTFASVDWLMSLEPGWSSTIFGVYVFAGMAVTALAAVGLATLWARSTGRLTPGLVRDDHLYNFGGLMFAFVCFWSYIAYSQYMLVWYANQPEESTYMTRRLDGGWMAVAVVLWVIRFGVPFVVLLSRQAKMNVRVLVGMSALMLVGEAVDLYWMIMPAYHTQGPVLGWQEFGPLLLAIGLAGLAIARFAGRYPLVASGDPMLAASRDFHL